MCIRMLDGWCGVWKLESYLDSSVIENVESLESNLDFCMESKRLSFRF